MGRAKQHWEEINERGWNTPDGFVCVDCVEDDHLKALIKANPVSKCCSCCGKKRRKLFAAPIEDLMPSIEGAVRRRFSDPDSAGVPWDGGPVDEGVSTLDMLFTLPLEGNYKFIEVVEGCFHNQMWVDAADGLWLSPTRHEVLSDTWQRFVYTVKHRTRFFFQHESTQNTGNDWDYADPPGQLLQQVGELVGDIGLIRQISPAKTLYRARVRTGNKWEPNAQELGAPPEERASAGRMNPAGISYLYTALEEGTALAETASVPPLEVVVATFATSRELLVLDLCALPNVPSQFDLSKKHQIDQIAFLHEFVSEISQPVSKHDDERIAYVPTQVVSEWFAQVFRLQGEDSRLDGIVYPSAVRPGGKNLVLFPHGDRWERTFDAVSYVDSKELNLVNWAELTKLIA